MQDPLALRPPDQKAPPRQTQICSPRSVDAQEVRCAVESVAELRGLVPMQ